METIILKVGGMSCMGCVNSVKKMLEPLPGVASVDVDLAGGSAKIVYDPSQAGPDEFKRTLNDGGYPVPD